MGAGGGNGNPHNLLGPLNLAVLAPWNCHLPAVHVAHFLTSFRSGLKYQFTTKACSGHRSQHLPPEPLLSRALMFLLFLPRQLSLDILHIHLCSYCSPPLKYKIQEGRTVLFTTISAVPALGPGMLQMHPRGKDKWINWGSWEPEPEDHLAQGLVSPSNIMGL